MTQTFAADPTDAELAVLLDPGGRSVSLDRLETPDGFTVAPRGFPVSFIAVCAGVPTVMGVLVAVNRALDCGFGWPATVALGVLSTLVAGMFTAAGVGFVTALDRPSLALGPFFTFDRASRTLALPRRGVTLTIGDVCGFVVVRTWHTVRDEEGSDSTWLAELSVLARDGAGKFVRYPVVTCMRTDKVGRLAAELAAAFGVEARTLTPGRRAPAARGLTLAGTRPPVSRPGPGPLGPAPGPRPSPSGSP